MKYHVFTRDPAGVTTIIDTDSITKAARAYYGVRIGCGCPRLEVDGRQLPICDADALTFKTLRRKKDRAAQVWNEALKERLL